MEDGWLRVRARVTLLTAAEGGRSGPVIGGVSYRPNHNFFDPENGDMTMGLIDLPADQTLNPGDTAEIEIVFNVWPGVENEYYPGRVWRIQEGGKLVGHGEILAVLRDES